MSNNKLSLKEKLSKIQAELKVPKGQKNTHGNYMYRSAEDILEALKKYNEKYNVLFLVDEQLISIAVGDKQYPTVISTATILDCDTDERISATASGIVELLAKGMHMPQRTGAAGSYSKKYALGNLLLIDDTKDADATNVGEEPQAAPAPAPAPSAPSKPEKKAMTAAVRDNLLKGIEQGKFEDVKARVKKYTANANRKIVVDKLMAAIEGKS